VSPRNPAITGGHRQRSKFQPGQALPTGIGADARFSFGLANSADPDPTRRVIAISTIDERRHNCAISVLGGPTTVVDLAGRRLVIDPTFDPPGAKGYLTKTEGPAVSEAQLGPVDVVLVSHDEHPDNLDERGREFARSAPLVVTGTHAAPRLGPRATGLVPWETVSLPDDGQDRRLRIHAVPAVHGPSDGARDADGNVNCQVTGFVITGDGVPTVYLSGDNASLAVVAKVANRLGPIDVAVLFVGAARVPAKERGRALTLTSARAAAAAEVLGARTVVPAHYAGWAHFSEGLDRIVEAFEDAGISPVLKVGRPGEWVIPE
jgi:L-ascorbate metabolism protein UlaG (beta-lactamase superfamily)